MGSCCFSSCSPNVNNCVLLFCLFSLQQLLLVQTSDSHPEEDDGDQGDDKDHEEADGDPDEGRGVDTDGLPQGLGLVDHDLLLVLRGQGELDVVGGDDLGKRRREKIY